MAFLSPLADQEPHCRLFCDIAPAWRNSPIAAAHLERTSPRPNFTTLFEGNTMLTVQNQGVPAQRNDAKSSLGTCACWLIVARELFLVARASLKKPHSAHDGTVDLRLTSYQLIRATWRRGEVQLSMRISIVIERSFDDTFLLGLVLHALLRGIGITMPFEARLHHGDQARDALASPCGRTASVNAGVACSFRQ